jgi:DNA-binding MarR family transcriptional regulator
MKKYLTFLEKVNLIQGHLKLTSHQLALLHFAAHHHDLNVSLTIRDFIDNKEIASQATLHKALRQLVDKQLLICRVCPDDGRIKNVVLGEQALLLFNRIEKVMLSI